MDLIKARIEDTLERSLSMVIEGQSPPKLGAAMRYAVFPGGARIRPQLCIAVGMACGARDDALVEGAAAAIELLHCASLVHDDLPCFDDATTRRGKLSLHRAFGERLAVLTGDALIVLAFQTIAASAERSPAMLPALLTTLARCVGMPAGIAAGQAWECEPRVNLAEYQRAKTGALFAAATMAGAQAAGAPVDPWRAFGERLGEAYQVADDIRDVVADPESIGKPVGRDLALGRPSAARQQGLGGALQLFERLISGAVEAVPAACRGAGALRALVRMEAQRLVPPHIADSVAVEAVRVAA